ncbi:uncharacterized protein KNAG_0L01430 [Huiozyma naganishii CBS 8797]|uniref:Purine-cytosine permease n=1 Tax=Huiozyma naganishii (strain ATCC MYA-139 / BCRC 22969 / CBS 8797 / KCTC 17520 / NBRC 10181 / NCYC 3082 / Yp74L-3) TaxID=1071383 RepID=J7RS83_HUIN7|nr:hypothetical protein KNAG_0L01430 [Kazachstania naganishii CBS 8797]CCK72763.1 hypothetical protein KNAG_0L01430 [Kazachstania naganishii CBS 8797]
MFKDFAQKISHLGGRGSQSSQHNGTTAGVVMVKDSDVESRDATSTTGSPEFRDMEKEGHLGDKSDVVSQVHSMDSNESYLFRLVSKLKAEVKGIEPITDEEKTERNPLHAANMWFSANLVLSAFAVGALGPCIYGLNFGASCLTILFFNLLGVFPVAYFSVFGARTGMRQMILSRYLMGNLTGRFFSLINVVSCVGWCVLNTIVSAQLLNMVNHSGHRCPLWAGCLLVLGLTVVISFFGYKVIHTYEQWSWIPNLAIFFVIAARLHKSGKWSNGDWAGGPTTAGGVLSLGCAVFGYAGAWTTYAADFTVYLPRNSNKTVIFLSLFCALSGALCFSMFLGAACGMGAVNDPVWAKLYEENAVGGIIYAVLVPKSLHGFGEFCCVVFALSTVGNNLPNMYTAALSAQALWEPFARVPRAFWTVAGNGAALSIAIPACYFFVSFLENFMNTVAYYSAIYITLGLCEHIIFRRCDFNSYDPADWRNSRKLPIGYASFTAFFVSAFGVALGMDQTYWVGEIARLIGKNGGDVGLEMGASWSFIVYVILRPLELKYVGR